MTRSAIKTLPSRAQPSLVERMTIAATEALTRRRDRQILTRATSAGRRMRRRARRLSRSGSPDQQLSPFLPLDWAGSFRPLLCAYGSRLRDHWLWGTCSRSDADGTKKQGNGTYA